MLVVGLGSSAVLAKTVPVGTGATPLAVTVTEDDGIRMVLHFEVGAVETDAVEINGVEYQQIHLGNEVNMLAQGNPELPRATRHLIIPIDGIPRLKVLSADYVDIPNIRVAPSKGEVPISKDLDKIPYEFGSVYEWQDWYPGTPAELGRTYQMRDYRGVPIRLYPVQYNPATHTLRVYTSIDVELNNYGTSLRAMDIDRPAGWLPMPEYEELYAQMFLNYERPAKRAGTTQAAEALSALETHEMLIIVYDQFRDAMQPFVEWKEQRGLEVNMVNVSETYDFTYTAPSPADRFDQLLASLADIPTDTTPGRCCYGDNPYDPLCDITTQDGCDSLAGTWMELPWPGWTCDGPSYQCEDQNSSSGLKNFIQYYYDSLKTEYGFPTLSYVLLVGDDREVSPIPYRFVAYDEDYYVPSDYLFSLLDGGSSDNYADCFVGRFSAQNVEQVETQVQRSIEYEKSPQGTGWFGKAACAARDDHITYMNGIRVTLLNGGFTEVDQIYGDDVSGAELVAVLNQGRSIVNYAGHGDVSTWVSLHFSTGSVDQLQNQGMLPFVFSIACNPGFFDKSYDCLGEHFVNATDAVGEPIGAIGSYMSASSQVRTYVDVAQQQFNQWLVGGNRGTFGGLVYAGASALVGQGWSKYAKTWVYFGDPSTMARFTDPAPLELAHPGNLFYTDGSYSVTVNSEGSPVEGAACTLYGGGKTYGTSMTDALGVAVIPIAESIVIPGPLTLTATGSNTATVQQNVMVDHDLVLLHNALADTKETVADYEFVCTVLSDSPLTEFSPRLLWGVIGWFEPMQVTMTPTGNPCEYHTLVPAQSPGDVISYKIICSNTDADYAETGWLEFEVIDYQVAASAGCDTVSNVFGHEAWCDVTVTNDGNLYDRYSLDVASVWPVMAFDSTGMSPLELTPLLWKDESYTFKLRVDIGSGVEGDFDNVTSTFTSLNDPTETVEVSFVVLSEGTPLQLPFAEYFDETTVNTQRWYDCGAPTINDAALYGSGGPTPYSLVRQGGLFELNEPGVCESIVGLTSKQIDLNSYVDVYFCFWYERTGSGNSPETGDDLIWEYYRDDGEWRELCSPDGGGEDMTEFDSLCLHVPPAGLHPRFQVRVRSVSDFDPPDDELMEPRDTWYIDNIIIYTTDPSPLPAPLLAAPASGTSSYTDAPTLCWHPVATATLYEVQIDQDGDFYDVYGSAQVTDTSWQVTPNLAYATYRWRVRARQGYYPWGAWSDVWTYTHKRKPIVSCPVLFAHNGDQFVEENPLLTACETSNYEDVVTDYYRVTVPLAVQGGVVRFELRELEDEITYLEDIRLMTVAHDPALNLGVTPDGQTFTYTESLFPVAAVDRDGVDHLRELQAEDEVRFEAEGPGELVVTFDNPYRRTALIAAAGEKPECPIVPIIKKARDDSREPNPPAEIALKKSDGQWSAMAAPPTRDKPAEVCYLIEPGETSESSEITLRIRWNSGYSADVVRLALPVEISPLTITRAFDAAHLTANGGAAEVCAGFGASDPLIMRKGDVFSFSFEAADLSAPGLVTEYIIAARGRYEPDPNALSDGLPRRFFLADNYPNPFNPDTRIEFDLPVTGPAYLEIINIIGQRVRTLVSGVREAGHHVAVWDGRNDHGEQVASGVYFYRLKAGDQTATKKMMLVK